MIAPRWWDDKSDDDLVDMLTRRRCPADLARDLVAHRDHAYDRRAIDRYLDEALNPFRLAPNRTPPALRNREEPRA